MSSSVTVQWHVGVAAALNREPVVRLVNMPRRQGKNLAVRLSEAMRRGLVKSAWGDNDTPDEVGLTQPDGTVQERMAAASLRRDEEILKQALEAEEAEKARAAIAAEISRLETQAAIEQMEKLEGYGSF